MDVGLNNRNTLGEVDPALKDIVFLVEANTNEQFEIWKDWAKDSTTNIEPLDQAAIETLAEVVKSWPVLKRVSEINDKLKQNYHRRVEWEQVMMGFMLTIGHMQKGKKKLPICVSFSFAIVEGKKVCFYHCCSRAADHTMVEDWLIKRFQLTHDGYSRWNHSDAANFHNCLRGLESLDKKPRNTKYKGHR